MATHTGQPGPGQEIELGDYRTWAQEGEGQIWMPRYVAQQLCTVTEGYDQPAKYNIDGSPLSLDYPFMCCNECAKLPGGQTSAVYKYLFEDHVV